MGESWRKWFDHRGHKSSLRHTSSTVWFTRTIDTTASSGRSQICLSCGSRRTELRNAAVLMIALLKRHRGGILHVLAFIPRRDKVCLSDPICLLLAPCDGFSQSSRKTNKTLASPFGQSPPIHCKETQTPQSFGFSSQTPTLWFSSHRWVMRSHPLLRWLKTSIAHSLWNLSSTAADDSFHSPDQPKY